MDKPQFDQPLGGSQALPPRIPLAKLLEPRLQEIQTLRNFLKGQTTTKMAFQTLPKHMRRRAMSHNVKRLPRRLRDIHTNQMKKSGTPVSQKRPSRRYRRRPANLAKEYQIRNGKKNRWLTTHVWHAKRFHMTEKWGYKLPYSPCGRAFRACYRAVTKYCLVQDISFVSCIQIEGLKSIICEKLQTFGQSGTGLNISAKAFSGGNREGNIVFCDISGVPIGPVKFQWQPNLNEADTTNKSKLWLWVHAAFFANTLETLVNLFELHKTSNDCETDCYTNETTKIILTNLRSHLSRFRLTGPLASAVLHDTFVLSNTEPQNSWISRYFTANPQHLPNMTNQAQVWQSLGNVADVSEISPHTVVSLIVKDPRFNIPQKRTKIKLPESKIIPISSLVLPTIDKPQSPIWEEEFRKASVATKMSSHKINEVHSKLLVPGVAKPDTESLMPVMLIQQPGNRTGSIGFGSGWDLVIPSEWSVPFWIAIVMRCARPGGLRENDSILFEAGKTNYFFAPDTEAGRKEEQDLTKQCKDKFFRKPPNKRTNFNKFNIASPFECKWRLLIGEWKTGGDKQAPAVVDNFCVIRRRDVLCQIEQLIQPSKKATQQTLPNCTRDDCLVPVKVTCSGKGRLRDFAVICLPKPNENGNKKRRRHGESEDPVEPVSSDVHQQKRKELRKTHRTLLKRLRRKRIKHKREHKKKLEPDMELLANYTKQMRELWLPEPTTIRNSCSRQVMGFIQTGGFSYFLGQSSGMGYIAAGALPELLNLPVRNKVLVRNTNTRQYRWARLSIITDLL